MRWLWVREQENRRTPCCTEAPGCVVQCKVEWQGSLLKVGGSVSVKVC